MERDHMVEHDSVLSFAGADCFSIFRMSIVVLSLLYKKRTLYIVSRIGCTVS